MRFLSRHLQATIQDHVEAYLVELGWIGPASLVPLSALPVVFQRIAPQEDTLQSLKPNLVAVSFGSQTDDEDEEMGGGLVNQEHVFFVDVMAENNAIALAIAEDVRDLLTGRATYPGRSASRFVRLQDHASVPPTPVVGYQVELLDVHREPSTRRLLSAEWQVISGTARIYLPGEN